MKVPIPRVTRYTKTYLTNGRKPSIDDAECQKLLARNRNGETVASLAAERGVRAHTIRMAIQRAEHATALRDNYMVDRI
jgi:hypothetical protein